MNKAAKVNGVYYSPIGNFDSFLIVPIGQTIPKPGEDFEGREEALRRYYQVYAN